MRDHARALGFTLVGITTPEPTEHLSAYRRWLAEGRHGGMGYLARPDAVARRGSLQETLPGVRSVVVVGHEYCQQDPGGVPDDPSRAVIARYARGRDYHKVVKKKLTALGRWLEGASEGAVAWRAYVDTGPILERDLARRAGLGWFGKNTMMINPKRGSYFFLGVLLTDLALTPDEPFEADHCGSCRACLDACPTGALLGRDASGAPVMDATRCISYLTIEHRGAIPEALRPLLGNRVYGCDICQEVCPFAQKFSVVAAESDYAARPAWEAEWDRGPDDPDDEDALTEAVIPTTDGPALVDLMRMSEAEWDAYTRGSAMRRAGYSGLRRNVAIALGNWLAGGATPDPEAVGELVAALSDEDPVVGEAAAWGLGCMAPQ
ncbi:MAG TPA: tRNA epoxyqueuosine(34) reductase QueG [Longimicrobiales bacterium]|nr:tRNA epoxyqueuosine(34) reductase QueG [Longimicrobiales bacterium]